MARAEAKEIINVPIEKFYQVITDYEKYPEFIKEMTDIEVLEEEDGVKVVEFHINLMKAVKYSLKLEETNPPSEINWTLVESDFFKKNDGGWKLEKVDENTTEATYFIDCDFKILVPSMIVNSVVRAQLPKMLHSFKERAESL